MTIQGSAINADLALVINAGRDVNITAAQDTHGETHDRQEQHSASGFAKGLATVIGSADPAAVLIPNSPNQVAIAALITKQGQAGDQATSRSTAVGSQLTGGSIAMQSGRDTLVQGAAIVADGNVSLTAQRDLTITTAQSTESGHRTTADKTTGLLRFDATGNSVGKRAQDQAEQTTAVSHTASQIVSLGKGGEAGNQGGFTPNQRTDDDLISQVV